MPSTVNTAGHDPVAIGKRIAELREQRGLSQRQLAGDGCNNAYISVLEKGARSPSLDTLAYLAARLGTSARYLRCGQLEPWQEGLDQAGLEAGQLFEHERRALDISLEHAERHAANVCGSAILEERIRQATIAYLAGATIEDAARTYRAPLQILHDQLTLADHRTHADAASRQEDDDADAA